MNEKKRLCTGRLLSFIVLLISLITASIVTGFMEYDPIGIVAGFSFFIFVIFLGYIADITGFIKYFERM